MHYDDVIFHENDFSFVIFVFISGDFGQSILADWLFNYVKPKLKNIVLQTKSLVIIKTSIILYIYIICNLYWLFNTCINFQNHVVLAKRQNTKWLSRDYGLIKLTQKIFQWANGYSISQTLLELPTVLDTGVY